MNAMPRQQYGLGSFVKKAVKGVTGAVKGVAKGVKDFASSDAGKLALLAAGGYYLGGGQIPGLMKGSKFGFLPQLKYGNAAGTGFGFGNILPNILNTVGATGTAESLFSKGIPGASAVSNFIGDNKGIIGASLLGGVLGSLTPQEQEDLSVNRNVGALETKLRQAYKNQRLFENDPEGLEKQIASDLSEYNQDMYRARAAYGGRMNYQGGEIVQPSASMMVDTTTSNPIPEDADRQAATEIARAMMAVKSLPPEDGEIEDTETMSTKDFMINEYFKPKRKQLMENFGLSMEEANSLIREVVSEIRANRDNRAMGGRMGFALGPDNPETNAMQAAGIEGLPLNQNPAGVTELDLRETGGFIPPVGVKEKADDIPAMLANNEFVFTADAVRGMGNGDVNKGAQRMYDMMKKLEKGGRV